MIWRTWYCEKTKTLFRERIREEDFYIMNDEEVVKFCPHCGVIQPEEQDFSDEENPVECNNCGEELDESELIEGKFKSEAATALRATV